MATVAMVLHPTRPQARALAAEVISSLDAQGHRVILPESDAALVHRPDLAVSDADLGPKADLAVSLGGDGTMLRSVELVAEAGVALIGVNLGQLGYLTEVEPHGVHEALDDFFAGRYQIEERMLLAVRIESGSSALPTRMVALNEAVLERTLGGHTVRLDVGIDGADFTPYAADGLIVATPTGSTAYAFSARGPIIAPTHRALLLTPVSPHMLFDRSLILEASTVLTISVTDRPAALTIDGRGLGELQDGDRIECTAAGASARLVIFKPREFHQILKRKFGLSDR
jgi:NAD+ kinase